MLQKFRITLFILLTLGLSNPVSTATLPLNTGYDYSNWNVYPATVNDDYWIRIASYPTMAVGASWAVAHNSAGAPWISPPPGPTGIPSMWINAFGPTAAGPGGSVNDPKYAIFRKCFCLPVKFSQPTIRGTVLNDDSIQIWLNSQLNTVVAPTPLNFASPLTFSYNNQSKFRLGSNCLYALVEDTGGHMGFDLAANLTVVSALPPMIAKGPNMSYEPCSCAQGKATDLQKMEMEEQETVRQIIKFAEERRLKKLPNQKN